MRVITESVSEVIITGEDRNKDIGVMFRNQEPIHIEHMFISNVFMGWLKMTDAPVSIGRLQVYKFGGDGGNLRGSNLKIDNYTTYSPTPTRPYNTLVRLNNESIAECLYRNESPVYDPSMLKFIKVGVGREIIPGYHVDSAFQAYAVLENGYSLDNSGEISNIDIRQLYVDTDGLALQTIALTERNRYTGFNIGYEQFDVQTAKPVGIIANQLDSSLIGCVGANCNTEMLLDARKDTAFETYDVTLDGVHTVNQVDPYLVAQLDDDEQFTFGELEAINNILG